MADMNTVNLSGNLVRDLEVTYTNGGMPIGKGSIAVSRNAKKNDTWIKESYFFDFTIFGKSAENLKQYLLKGKKIGISGTLKQDTWEKDGQKHSKIGIIANEIFLFGSSEKNNSGNNLSNQKSAHVEDNEGFSEDIPFGDEPNF